MCQTNTARNRVYCETDIKGAGGGERLRGICLFFISSTTKGNLSVFNTRRKYASVQQAPRDKRAHKRQLARRREARPDLGFRSASGTLCFFFLEVTNMISLTWADRNVVQPVDYSNIIDCFLKTFSLAFVWVWDNFWNTKTFDEWMDQHLRARNINLTRLCAP